MISVKFQNISKHKNLLLYTSVLKYRFYSYSRIVRPTDQEIVATEKVVHSSSQEERSCHNMEGPHSAGDHVGNLQDQPRGKGSKKQMWARVFIVVSLGRKG